MTTTEEIMALAQSYTEAVYKFVRTNEGMNEVLAAGAAFRAAVESLVADAERYRWLRDEDEDPTGLRGWFCPDGASAADCDAAIDLCISEARAALKASQP